MAKNALGIYARGNKLWMRVKFPPPKGWKSLPTTFEVGQELLAKALRERVIAKLKAGEEYTAGPLTVKAYGATWLEQRKLNNPDGDHDHDERRLRLHIYPVIKDMRIDEVRVRHMLEIVNRMKRAGAAPRSIRNAYSVASAMFRYALIEELIFQNPCVLEKPHLPAVEDKHDEWRSTAIYTPAEVIALTTDPRIPHGRRVYYALLALGMVRLGEAAGLRIATYMRGLKPLGRLVIAKSYKGRTKTRKERWMPVHPTLAAILGEWLLTGWAKEFGRAPAPDDLVVPRAAGPKRGKMWSKEHAHYFFTLDLEMLGFRHRRIHDLRRTGISFAREAGADKDVLRLCTHKPPKDVMELYTTLGWTKLCAQISPIDLRAMARAAQ